MRLIWILIFACPLAAQVRLSAGSKIGSGNQIKAIYVAPTFVTSDAASSGASSVSSITTGTLTAGSSDVFYLLCHASLNTATFTSSISTAVMLPLSTTRQSVSGGGGSGASQLFVFFHPPSGSTTLTCKPSTSTTFLGYTVLQFHGGSMTTLDTSPSDTNTSTATPTTLAFTTTYKGLIVACFGAAYSTLSSAAGLIGVTTATLTPSYPANLDSPCEYTIPTSSQSSITAAMAAGTSGNWMWHVSAWK